MSGAAEPNAGIRLPQRSAGAIALAVALIGLGIFVTYQGYSIATEQSAYARVGPHIFPYIVGLGLMIVGGLLAREAWRGSWTVGWADASDGQTRSPHGSWRQLSKVALVALGLVVNALLITRFGFIVASTVMFAFTTRAFGSRRILLDVAVGAFFSSFIFLGFTYALGLPLPAGTFWGSRWMF